MRRLTVTSIVVLGLCAALGGCGSDAGDRLVLSFVGFGPGEVEQADAVLGTHAEVDVCQFLCDDLTAEPFTQTTVTATFVNRGKSDIFLDRYTVFAEGSGIDPITRSIGRIIPGGRCTNDPQKPCALDNDCVGATCLRRETDVDLLFYDFDFKQRVIVGRCPSLSVDPDTGEVTLIPGQVIPQTLGTRVSFSGVDDSNERFTVTVDYVSTFDNFDNCEDN